MSNVRSRNTTEVTVRGRVFEVERIAWKGTSGLSFDVFDKATKCPLNDESFDDRPDVEDIEQVLDNLAEDFDSDTLEPLLQDHKGELFAVLADTNGLMCTECRDSVSKDDSDDTWVGSDGSVTCGESSRPHGPVTPDTANDDDVPA